MFSALQKSETSGYIEVECHPIISIPAPHDEVQYSEVRSLEFSPYNMQSRNITIVEGGGYMNGLSG